VLNPDIAVKGIGFPVTGIWLIEIARLSFASEPESQV